MKKPKLVVELKIYTGTKETINGKLHIQWGLLNTKKYATKAGALAWLKKNYKPDGRPEPTAGPRHCIYMCRRVTLATWESRSRVVIWSNRPGLARKIGEALGLSIPQEEA